MIDDKVYVVTITETLAKDVFIAASTMEEAEQIAQEEYDNGNIILTDEDFIGVADIACTGIDHATPDFT